MKVKLIYYVEKDGFECSFETVPFITKEVKEYYLKHIIKSFKKKGIGINKKELRSKLWIQ